MGFFYEVDLVICLLNIGYMYNVVDGFVCDVVNIEFFF